MLSGLLDVKGCGQVLPFVRMFYASPSSCFWEDSCGVCAHDSPGGRRRTRGCFDAPFVLIGPTQGPDPVGVARGRVLVRAFGRHLRGGAPERVSVVYASMQEDLWAHSRIRVHTGKTQVWNKVSDPMLAMCWNCCGNRSQCTGLERVRRHGFPEAQQGMKVLGAPPLGHPVAATFGVNASRASAMSRTLAFFCL